MIFIGSDHGGFALKNVLIEHLKSKNLAYRDFGVFSVAAVDYPDVAEDVCNALLDEAGGAADFAVLVCGTGVGISMAANKIKGIRCAVAANEFSARMAKAHNHANALAFGGRVTGPDAAKGILDAFLEANEEGGRHDTRVEKIMALEEK
jgi:ribose 5-phosphate isomerase B